MQRTLLALTASCALAFAGAAATAEGIGWVLYPPLGEQTAAEAHVDDDGKPTSAGAAYMQELLGGYAGTGFGRFDAAQFPLKDQNAVCAQHLSMLVRTLEYQLSGTSYKLSLEVTGEAGPMKGVSCRIQTERNTSVQFEVLGE